MLEQATDRPIPTPLGWHLQAARIPAAWCLTRGRGVTIAVIDDAVDTRHPEFRGRVVPGRDVEARSGDTRPRGWEPHGTKCAGVACAAGLRVSGVAPAARLMPIRVPSLSRGVGLPTEAAAIRWAAEHGADVICCAWGPPAPAQRGGTLPAHTRAAINRAVQHGRGGRGCVIVWSAGNDGCDISHNGYASYSGVVAVGACNDRGTWCRYSNWGDALWCVFPSSDTAGAARARAEISTTTPVGSFRLGETFYTDSFGHTSAACAGVAGLCALILSANPDLAWREVKEMLRASCVRVDESEGMYDASGHSRYYGYGRPDAARAVELARALRSGTHATRKRHTLSV